MERKNNIIELSIEDLELIYGGGLGERILEGGANGAQIGGSIGAGIGLGVGIVSGGIPAGPAIILGGTVGAAVGAATGMGVAAYEYYQETQPKGTVTVGPISAFVVDKSGNGYTDSTNYC
ncbi:TPA: bacteriocin transporter [Neisseria meningitidis]|uniref:bacteriocin transporter n=1 Tax=Neisseria meningitidis TaxID=487 RepID=UPI000E56F3F4|nr:bacteriocin transporter [Neisseria meningitidis]